LVCKKVVLLLKKEETGVDLLWTMPLAHTPFSIVDAVEAVPFNSSSIHNLILSGDILISQDTI